MSGPRSAEKVLPYGGHTVPHDPLTDDGPCPICNEPWPCAERNRQRKNKREIDRYLDSALYKPAPERVEIDGYEAIRWESPLNWWVDLSYGPTGLVVIVNRWDGDHRSEDADLSFVMDWLP